MNHNSDSGESEPPKRSDTEISDPPTHEDDVGQHPNESVSSFSTVADTEEPGKSGDVAQVDVRELSGRLSEIPRISSGRVDDPFSLRGVRGQLVGRSAELTELVDFFRKTTESKSGGKISIIGNQGTGKSRLLDEFFREVPKQSRIYCCASVREGSPKSTIAALLRARFSLLDGMPEAAASTQFCEVVEAVLGEENTSEAMHVLGRLLDLDFPDSPFLRVLSDNPKQYSEIEKVVVRRFFENDAAHGPILLAVDDLQWADEASLSTLMDLARNLRSAPVVLVVCAHPKLLMRMPEWRDDSPSSIAIALRNLSDRDATLMFQEMLSRCALLPPDIVEDAVEMTGGNPHFLDQLTRLYLANGTIDTSGILWKLDPDRAMDTNLPVTVEEVIEARISSLEFDERVLLEMGAVFGNVFWLGSVIALSRLENDCNGGKDVLEVAGPLEYNWKDSGETIRREVSQLMDQLVHRDYLLRLDANDSTVSGDVEFVFKHNLERELIAKGTEKTRLERYHRLAAQWIETTSMANSDDQLEFLGQLYERGGDNRRAAYAYISGGDRARARFANEQAAELYRQGLSLLGTDDVVVLLDALHNMGAVVDMLGKTEEAQILFTKMLHYAWLLDHRAKGGAAHNRLGRIYRRLGAYDLAMGHLRSAQELFKAADDKRGIAGTLDDIGQVHWLRGAYGQALSFHRQALAIRRGIGDVRSIALSLANIGRVHHETGGFKAASRQFGEALKLRQEIQDRAGVIQSLCDIGRVESADGNHPAGEARFLEAKTIALEIGDRLAQTEILACLSECQANQSRHSEAIASLLEGKSIAYTLGNRPATSDCYRRLTEIYISGGDIVQANECAKRALAIGVEVGARLHIARAHRATAEAVFSQGRTDEELSSADEHYRKAVEILAGMKNELELARTYRSYAVLREHVGSEAEAEKLRMRSDEIFARLRGASQQDRASESQGRVRLGTAQEPAD